MTTDRLKEIKARWPRGVLVRRVDSLVKRVDADKDMNWLIHEVERLRNLVMAALGDGLELGAEIQRTEGGARDLDFGEILAEFECSDAEEINRESIRKNKENNR